MAKHTRVHPADPNSVDYCDQCAHEWPCPPSVALLGAADLIAAERERPPVGRTAWTGEWISGYLDGLIRAEQIVRSPTGEV